MATSIKISQLPAKGANLEATDLLEVSEFNGTGYVSKSITGQEIIDSVPAPATAWGTITGTLSAQTDLNTALSGKVPTTRTLTINGTTQDLSADRTFTISTGITIGTTAITSGTVGRVLFEGTGNVVQESANLFWDNTNGRLGIGTSTPTYGIDNATTSRVLGSSFNATTSGTLVSGTTTIVNMNYGEVPKTYLTGGTFIDGTLQLPTTLRVITTGGGIQFQQQSAPSANSILSFGNNSSGVFFGNFSSLSLKFLVSNIAQMTIASTGNVAINTTTDAGYKLDVNGTARVQGDLTVTGTRVSISNAAMSIDANVGTGYYNIRNNSGSAGTTAITLGGNTYLNIYQPISASSGITSGTINTITTPITYAWASGTASPNLFQLNPNYNFTGTYTGTARGFYYNPTLTSIVGLTHFAFHSTSGRHRYENLPTSSAGLASGDLWNDAGTLKIV